MTATAEVRQATAPTMNFRQRERLSQSARDRRKPLYQAVSATLPTSRRAKITACDCIKDGSFIDAAGTNTYRLHYYCQNIDIKAFIKY